jgi:hypothetical protein
MFSNLFNFGFQRTPLQALGWYLFFLLIAGLIGGIASGIAAQFGLIHANTFDEGYQAGMQIGRYSGIIVPVVLGFALLFSKPITPLSFVVTLVGLASALFAGFLGGGIFFAYLTTRPARGAANIPSTVVKPDEQLPRA